MVRTLRTLLAAVLAVVVTLLAAPPVGAAPGVTVRGTVLDTVGDPVEGIAVTVSSGSTSVQVTTAADGTYVTPELPDGAYSVSFADVDGIAPQHPTQFWPKVWSSVEATPVVLSAASATEVTGIDAALPVAASVSGTITDTGGGPIDGACVNAWSGPVDESRWLGNVAAASDGTYTIPWLPPVDVVLELVDCSLPTTYLSTELAPIALDPGAVIVAVDGQLTLGATISGTVRDEGGAPLSNICVSEERRDDGGISTTTGKDGTYQLGPLAAGELSLDLAPCDDQPYLPTTVGPLTVETGAELVVGDTTLERGTVVSGTVRDDGGSPVADVCVQLSDDAHVAGSDETGSDGTYAVLLAEGGEFRVQFVDCGDTPSLAGTSTEVTVQSGADVSGLDATLEPGAPATVRGVVTNVRGEPMEGVCVVVYLAHETVVLGVTDSDGGYTVPSVGSGTWAIAYLTCGKDDDGPDVLPYVIDGATGVAWAPMWWGGAPLDVEQVEDQGPDPIAQGAVLVDLVPGGDSQHDACFGCDAIAAGIEKDGDVVRAEFVRRDWHPRGRSWPQRLHRS